MFVMARPNGIAQIAIYRGPWCRPATSLFVPLTGYSKPGYPLVEAAPDLDEAQSYKTNTQTNQYEKLIDTLVFRPSAHQPHDENR